MVESHIQGLHAQRVWTLMLASSNVRELSTQEALVAFQSVLQNQNFSVNSTTVAYLNHHGGSKSLSVLGLAQ